MSEGTLQALRDRINARLQTSAISRDRASAAGREVVAQCRQSDVETLEWVLSEIDAALLRTPSGEGEAVRVPGEAERPCDCSGCYCGNVGDAEEVGYADGWNACRDAMLAALRSEAQGEEDAVRRTWELAVQRAYGCLDYCGGYRGAELQAFHSGIMTVIRALEAGLDTVDTQTAALDRIGAARRGEGGGE